MGCRGDWGDIRCNGVVVGCHRGGEIITKDPWYQWRVFCARAPENVRLHWRTRLGILHEFKLLDTYSPHPA